MFSIVWSVMIRMNLYNSWGLEFLFWTQILCQTQDKFTRIIKILSIQTRVVCFGLHQMVVVAQLESEYVERSGIIMQLIPFSDYIQRR